MKCLFGLAMGFVLSGNAAAAIISVAPNSDGQIVTAGVDVTQVLDAANTNDKIWGFNEKQNVLLTSNLGVDGGSISAGRRVNSHMLFLNKQSNSPNLTRTAVFTFDGTILGVMSDSGGTLEAQSTSLLGVTSLVTYPATGFTNRGLEGGDSYTVSGNTLRITMSVAQPGDWIRVVTAVPEPTGIVLWSLGAVGLAFVRGRRKPA